MERAVWLRKGLMAPTYLDIPMSGFKLRGDVLLSDDSNNGGFLLKLVIA